MRNFWTRMLLAGVAKETAAIDATLAEVRILLLCVGALATLLSLGVLGAGIRFGLLPVKRIAGQIVSEEVA